MTKQSLMKGTIILTTAAFISKILGFVNSIIMAKLIGPEGVGLIMMALPITGLLITLTTLGLPVAISKLVAEAEVNKDYKKIKKILIVSLCTTSFLGVFIMLGSLIGAKYLASIFLTDERALYPMLAVIPIIPIIAVSSVIKGYFRGKQNMTPLALSQIIEQIVRISSIVLLVKWLLPYGVEMAAAGVVICGIIGEGVSLLYLLSVFKWYKRKRVIFSHSVHEHFGKGKQILFDLLQTGVPTTGNGLLHSIIGVFQPFLITNCLIIAGVGTALATKQFGILMGFVFPLLMLPGFITHSMAVPLIPAISEANEKFQLNLIQKRIQQAIRIALIVGVPCTVILYMFAHELTTVIYNSPEAAILLKIMAPFYFLQYFRTPLQSVLIGLGKANIVFINDLIASLFKLGVIFMLATQSSMGIIGVCLAFSASVVFGTSLHFVAIHKAIGVKIKLKDFIKVVTAGIFLGFAAFYSYDFLNSFQLTKVILLAISCTISMLIYMFLLRLFNILPLQQK